LTNLAKSPASTVQILGAEKALFRALKTKGNTPKYGLIYHSTFIGRADAKNKGRISRYLANKCSIATRIDSFSDEPSRLYGEKLREQVEERLKFYETGQAPRKNIDVMEEVSKQLKGGKSDKSSKMDVDDDDDDDADEKRASGEPESSSKKKKDKKNKKDKDKDKKKRKSTESMDVEAETPTKKSKGSDEAKTTSEKKKKKKSKE
jgi:nucleolar protein 56